MITRCVSNIAILSVQTCIIIDPTQQVIPDGRLSWIHWRPLCKATPVYRKFRTFVFCSQPKCSVRSKVLHTNRHDTHTKRTRVTFEVKQLKYYNLFIFRTSRGDNRLRILLQSVRIISRGLWWTTQLSGVRLVGMCKSNNMHIHIHCPKLWIKYCVEYGTFLFSPLNALVLEYNVFARFMLIICNRSIQRR